MNQPAQVLTPDASAGTEIAAVPNRKMSPTLQIILDDKMFERVKLVAKYMSEAEGFIPRHLLGKTSACFAVANQAINWNLDVYAVARCTYQTPGGSIGYEGKLCQAILENSGRVVGGIKYEHYGSVKIKTKDGLAQAFRSNDPALTAALKAGATVTAQKDWSAVKGKFQITTSQKGAKFPAPTWTRDDAEGLGVTVRAQVIGEPEPREWSFDLDQAFPLNSTLWATDPKTQICYTACRRFGNLAAPSLMMGVPFDREDFMDFERGPDNARDVTPEAPPRPTRAEFTKTVAESEPERRAETEETYILVDEAGNEEGRFTDAARWVAELTAAAAHPTRGAATLKNNAETARAICEETENDDLTIALTKLYEPPGPSTTGAGEAAGNGDAPVSSAPAASDAPAKAESDQPSQPQGEGLRAIVMPMKDKKPDVKKYVDAMREEISMCATEADVDALMSTEATNLNKIDHGKGGLVLKAQERKAEIAKKAAEGDQ